MNRCFFWLASVVLLLHPPHLSAADAPSLLKPGQTVSMSLPHGQGALLFQPQSQVGDYVQGEINVLAGRLTLDLIGADGRHKRRFVEGFGGKAQFRFVADDGGDRLQVIADEIDADFELSVTHGPGTHEPPVATRPALSSPRLRDLARQLELGTGTEAFWKEMARRGTPLIEDGPDGKKLMTFLFRGARRNARIMGAPSNDHEPMMRLEGSDVWYRTFIVPADTRLSYRIAPDIPEPPGSPRERRLAILATAQADPLNRHSWPADAPDAYNRHSITELEAAAPQPFAGDQGRAQGRIERIAIASRYLDNEHDVTLFRPRGFDPERDDNILMIVFDADEYLNKVQTPRILDNMIASGAIPPVAAAFVHNRDALSRGRELPANPDFADFLALELLPRLLRDTGLQADARRTVLAGSSYGGLAAVSAVLRHPAKFGNALSMSGSFWWHPPGTPSSHEEFIARTVVLGQELDTRFFLSAGLFEDGRDGHAGILRPNRHLRDVLQARGATVFHREYAGGHDYLVWRGAISDGLLALFGR